MKYIWQHGDWPKFTYSLEGMETLFLEFAEALGRIKGSVNALSKADQSDIVVNAMVLEALKTSEIEGEFISRQDLMSSIRRNLGLSEGKSQVRDNRATGIAQMMITVAENCIAPLSESMLFNWHSKLMTGNHYVKPGAWRVDEAPMQIVSGPVGKERVHFEAPPSSQVPAEMKTFIDWFNETAPGAKHSMTHAVVRSAIAHLYFETIHPFEDGNGRVGRAISDKVISQHAGLSLPISLSLSIERNRDLYYEQLKAAQKTLEITSWIQYFAQTWLDAQRRAEGLIQFTIQKARFFDEFEKHLNDRQTKVIRRMLAEGPEGFEGGINAKKYSGITGASKATSTRDLQDLREKGALKVVGQGRSTRYEVVL